MGFVKIDLDKKPEPEPKFVHIVETEESNLTFKEFCKHLEGADGHRLNDIDRDDEKALIAAAMKLSVYAGSINKFVVDSTLGSRSIDENAIMETLGRMLSEMYAIADFFNNDLEDVAKEAM